MEFEEIYEEFQPKIRQHLARFFREQDAEDMTQEAFAKVSRSLLKFKGISTLSTWIYRIATNTAIDKLRSPSFKHSSKNTPLAYSPGVEDRTDLTGYADEPTDRKVIRKANHNHAVAWSDGR
ncbi:MAG: sigma-70 family RNA polymerase sigma factor [Desulfobacterales bacterium]